MLAPGTVLRDDKRRHAVTVRADGTVALGADRRLDSQDRRAGTRPAGLQRLDVLVLRDRRPKLQPIDVLRARYPGSSAAPDPGNFGVSTARRKSRRGREPTMQGDSGAGRQPIRVVLR